MNELGEIYRSAVTGCADTLHDLACGRLLKQQTPTPVFVIIQQPQNATVPAGETVSFTVVAVGIKLSYQWQTSATGASWQNCSGTGNKTDTFAFTSSANFSGRLYRCIVTSGTESVISDVAKFTMGTLNPDFAIVQQPQDATVPAGETVSFTVVAKGENLTYQWQTSATGATWQNCNGTGNKTDTFTFVSEEQFSGRFYRCVVTSGTESIISDLAKFTMG